MGNISVVLAFILLVINSFAQDEKITSITQEEVNKQIARNFYQDLWFTNNTDNYSRYVSDTYVVHDIGARKGITESAIEQKNIADFFWRHGDFDSRIDFQIAERDLVATRWTGTFNANTLFGKFVLQTKTPISIINVFRIKDGKIVEFWNHRHDIETPQTLKFTLKGFLIGLLFSIIPIIIAMNCKKKLKKLMHS